MGCQWSRLLAGGGIVVTLVDVEKLVDVCRAKRHGAPAVHCCRG